MGIESGRNSGCPAAVSQVKMVHTKTTPHSKLPRSHKIISLIDIGLKLEEGRRCLGVLRRHHHVAHPLSHFNILTPNQKTPLISPLSESDFICVKL
jgi:hypothetical protein